jgi:hypothetical protein
VTVFPETLQTEEGLALKVTAKPELAVAERVAVTALEGLSGSVKLIVWLASLVVTFIVAEVAAL